MIAQKRWRTVASCGLVLAVAVSVMGPGPGSGQEQPAAEPARMSVDMEVMRPCPQDKIARLIETAVTDGQVSAALALERETLKLCAQRQELVLKLFGLERQLREILPEEVAAPEPQIIYKDKIVYREKLVEVAKPAAPVGPTVNMADLGYFSVFGSAAKPKAGIVLGDGSRVFLGVGDEVRGVGKVESISISPAEVRVAGALQNPLPLRKGQGK